MGTTATISVLLMTGFSPRCEVIKENLTALKSKRIKLEVVNNTSGFEDLQNYDPQITILDLANLRQPPEYCVKKVRKYFPDSRILVIHIYKSPSLIEPLFEYGADGYLTYEPSKNELENALLKVLDGKKFIPGIVQQR